MFVFFAKIVKFFCNIKKICNKYENIFAICFVEKFEFFDYEINNFVKTREKYFCVRNCKRCKQNFNFNNKFHEHVRKHHVRKFVKNLNFRIFASKHTCNMKKKSIFICSFVSFVSFIFFATSRNQKFWFSIIFESIIVSTRSHFSIATYKINSKLIKSAIVVCSFIFSFISSFDSVRKYQEFHIQKFYLTMNDLNRMFVEKSKLFDLQQHQNRCRFSQNFNFRQFDRSCSIFSKNFHFIIEKLFEMFDEKFKKKNLFQNQNNVFFQTFSNQIQIIVYFKFTINQKSLINRISKNSKSKISKHYMFAKSIRIVFNKNLFEKFVNLLYKMFDVFCVHVKFFVEVFFFDFHFFSFFSIFFLVFAFVSIIFVAKMNCINVY